MKKCLMMVLCCLLLIGCGGKKDVVDPAVLGPALLEGAGFPEGMLELEEDMVGSIFQIDMDTVTSCYAAVSGTAGADELLVLTADSEESARVIFDLLGERVLYRKESFADYLPGEAEKLRRKLAQVKRELSAAGK